MAGSRQASFLPISGAVERTCTEHGVCVGWVDGQDLDGAGERSRSQQPLCECWASGGGFLLAW